MRLFLAVNLPEATRRRVHEATVSLRAAAPGVRWVDPGSFHLTLKFLGEVPEQRLAEIQSALRAAAGSCFGFTIALGGTGAFPNFRRPRVFWIGTADSPPLVQLAGALERVFAPLGFPPEQRAYHPHLTLGRVSAPLPATEAQAAERAASEVEYEEQVTVKTVELMLSRLSPKGARYEVADSAALR